MTLAIRHFDKTLRRSVGLAMLAAAALALWAMASPRSAAQGPTSFRSANEVQTRPPDELDRPFWREAQSHRGWEIRENQYAVIANTSLGDARWAAANVKQVWSNAARLADRWTQVHRQPDFGLGSTQIVIDSEPLKQRDRPLTTVDIVGSQTQIYLNVAPGRPELKQQVLRLRSAAAFAMLHAAALDSAVPPWVTEGLSSYLAEQGLDPAELKAAQAVDAGGRFGGQQWRFKRSAQDVLDYQDENNSRGSLLVKFLMEGNDAQHAPALLNELRLATAAAEQTAARGGQFQRLPGDELLLPTDTPFDRLATKLGPQLEAWRKDPQMGQPLFEPDPTLPAELLQAEKEMLVVLKLQRKLAGRTTPGRPVPRVTTFDRATGRQVVVSTRTAAAPTTMRDLHWRLTDPASPTIATFDVDGSLLLSSDTQRIEQLLGYSGERYAISKTGEHVVAVRRLEGNRLLKGWLTDNPDNPGRPLAKFELSDGRTTVKQTARPKVQEARNRPSPRND